MSYTQPFQTGGRSQWKTTGTQVEILSYVVISYPLTSSKWCLCLFLQSYQTPFKILSFLHCTPNFAPLFFRSSPQKPLVSHLCRRLAFPFLPVRCLDHCHGICLLPCFAPGQMPSPAVPASSQHGSSVDSRPNTLRPAGICRPCTFYLCQVRSVLNFWFTADLFVDLFVEVRLFLTHTHAYLITHFPNLAGYIQGRQTEITCPISD